MDCGLRNWWVFELRDLWNLLGFQTQKWAHTLYPTQPVNGVSVLPSPAAFQFQRITQKLY